jgi:hypothetical protein
MKVQDILDALSSSEIVQEVVVIVLVQEPGKQALRAKATLKGGYVLHIQRGLGNWSQELLLSHSKGCT